MNPDFAYETAKLGQVLCSGVCEVTADEVAKVCKAGQAAPAAASGDPWASEAAPF